MSTSGFASPLWFPLLLALAALVVGYLLVQRRRRRHTLRFANLAPLERVAPRRQGWPRHAPTVLLLVGLVALTVALAGPTGEVRVPRNRATVILTIDVSLSMNSTDVTPTRLQAAQHAAKGFAHELTPGINLGLIAFSGNDVVLVSPTTDRAPIGPALDHLQLGERTATGEAISTSLQAIDTLAALAPGGEGRPPARIMLLSDGKQTVPERPNDPRGSFTAAAMAKTKGVPVSTISFGTAHGTVDIGGQPVLVPVDEPSMKQIAAVSVKSSETVVVSLFGSRSVRAG
jgi:Ca-activated chloride channel family protein